MPTEAAEPRLDEVPALVLVEPDPDPQRMAAELRRWVRAGHIVIAPRAGRDRDQITEVADQLGPIFTAVSYDAAGQPLGRVTPIEDRETVTQSLNWHHDQSFTPVPPDWTMLACLEPGSARVPTVWCDTARIVLDLSEGMVDLLAGLVAVHVARDADGRVISEARHPLLGRSEPRTLFAAPATVESIVGWHPEESRWFMRRLYDGYNLPEYTVTHRWSAGDIVVWPNLRYPHRALAMPTGSRRQLTRIVGHWEAPPAGASRT